MPMFSSSWLSDSPKEGRYLSDVKENDSSDDLGELHANQSSVMELILSAISLNDPVLRIISESFDFPNIDVVSEYARSTRLLLLLTASSYETFSTPFPPCDDKLVLLVCMVTDDILSLLKEK